MRTIIVFLLLLPFFHHHRSRTGIEDFIPQATVDVTSYDDGSVNAALEHSRIVQIKADIAQLSQMQEDGPESKALEDRISGEIKSLYNYDKMLSESSFV